MKKILNVLPFLILLFATACDKSPSATSDGENHNGKEIICNSPYPKFVNHDYIKLEKIGKISKFRSGIGHDYSDNFETCRNMKHYFVPLDSVDWSTIELYAPVDGRVDKIFDEWAGTQIQIKSHLYPDFTFVIFHVVAADTFHVGDSIFAGQFLGTHISDATYSDIAVKYIISGERKFVSFFEVMTDSLFQSYVQRGVTEYGNLIISSEERNASPLTCNQGTFAGEGSLENWVELN